MNDFIKVINKYTVQYRGKQYRGKQHVFANEQVNQCTNQYCRLITDNLSSSSKNG